MELPQLPQDKANHALYGAVICLVVGGFLGTNWGLLAALVAGVGKEVLDYVLNKRAGVAAQHDVSIEDAFATFAGGVLVFLASWVM